MKTSAVAREGRIRLKTDFANVARCQTVKAAVGGEWDSGTKEWVYPECSVTWDLLRQQFGIETPADKLVTLSEMPHKDFVPWQHQTNAYNFAVGLPAALLAHDMGCGKSMTAIGLLNAWGEQRVLIACPLSVVPVWRRQFDMHSPTSYNVVSLDNGGTVARRTMTAKTALNIDVPTAIVINYEAMWREPFASWALAQNWSAVVLDEIHRVKAPGGKASRFAAKLRERAARRIGLSGTPLAHSPLDAYAVSRALDVRHFGTSFTRFKYQHAIMGGFNGYEFIRLRDPERFSRILGQFMHRVEKRDVLDLPPVVHEQRYCTLSSESARVYREMENDFVAWLRSGVQVTASNALVKLLRLAQVTGGHIGDENRDTHVIGHDKINAFKDFLADFPAGEPLVVFCRFTADVSMVVEACEGSGRSVAQLTGAMKELDRWQNGDAEVLVAQIQVGSEGIDLTRGSTCVFYSVGYSLATYTQALARLDRPGQTRSVTYVHMLAKGTVDEKVMTALEKRQEVVDSILRGG